MLKIKKFLRSHAIPIGILIALTLILFRNYVFTAVAPAGIDSNKYIDK